MDRIAELMKHDTAGDPVSGLKWTHRTTALVAAELRYIGIGIGPRTVARLLAQMGYSLRVNHKKLPRASKTAPEDRNAQFEHIAGLREDFVVDCLEMWWLKEGRQRYPDARELVILADGGGANGSRSRTWKRALFRRLAERHGLSVTVAHYPPGTSKWNPIEHRLFSEISKNWAGRPLDSYATVLRYIRTTTTTTGITVTATSSIGSTRRPARSPMPRCVNCPSPRTTRCPDGTTRSLRRQPETRELFLRGP